MYWLDYFSDLESLIRSFQSMFDAYMLAYVPFLMPKRGVVLCSMFGLLYMPMCLGSWVAKSVGFGGLFCMLKLYFVSKYPCHVCSR